MPSVAESACLLLLGPERAPAVAARLASLLEKLEGRGGGTEGRGSGQGGTASMALLQTEAQPLAYNST